MGRYSPESWRTLFERQEKYLLEIDCVDALSVTSLDELQNSLQSMAIEYQHQGFPDIVNRLSPGLTYLQSFSNAISSASQYDPRACLVWGVVQAFVQSACQPHIVLTDMLELISELNECLVEFETYFRMFPDSTSLQAHLQDVFETYMDYCISCIKYMKKSSSRSFITYLFGSDPASSLRRAKDEVRLHIRLFKRTANLSIQKQKMVQNIGEELVQKPLAEPQHHATDQDDAEGVEFPINTVTLFRNYAFLGREQELRDMRNVLRPITKSGEASDEQPKQSKYGQDVACCILQGMGGIGKTQTALEFTFMVRNDYDAIFWIRAEMGTSVASAYVNMAKALGLVPSSTVVEGESDGQTIELTKKWLSTTTRKWIIVYDNVENIDDIGIYFPQAVKSDSAVIITTQKTDFYPFTENFTTIQIKDLTRDQGADLLYACLRRDPLDDEEKENARKISDLLGGLPLALTTIGGYIFQTNDSILDFLNYLKTSCNAWVASAVGPAKQYEKTLATVFEVALKELPEDARILVDILAFLNPDDISEDIFTNQIGKSNLAFLMSKPKFSDTIRSLRNRQLVGRDSSGSHQYLTIHRTVQMAILHDLSHKPDLRRAAYNNAFALVREALPKVSSIDNPDPGAWSEYQKYVPHILSIRAHCVWPEPPMEFTLEFAQVLSDMGTFMWHAGQLVDCIDAMRTAEEILDSHGIGVEHHLRGNVHERIGIAASHRGVSYRDEAMSRRHKAIQAREVSHKMTEIRRPITRDDEIRLWNVQSDMAFGLLQCEDFDRSGEIIEKCHEQYKRWGTPEEIPFEYLKYNHIISHTYMANDQPVDAVRACKEGVRLGEICCGVSHPMTLHVRFSMANFLFLEGMVDESLNENLIILQARIDVVGECNHYTLESHSMCGALYAHLDMLEKARFHLTACLDPFKSAAWDEESIARARYLYSDVLRRLGEHGEAEVQLREARAIRDQYLLRYPQWLKEDTADELVVFDQMVCLWAGRFTGKLKPKPEKTRTVETGGQTEIDTSVVMEEEIWA